MIRINNIYCMDCLELEEAKENYAIKHKNQTNMEIVERTCKECGQLTKVGKTTGECLKCLDWKMGDLRK